MEDLAKLQGVTQWLVTLDIAGAVDSGTLGQALEAKTGTHVVLKDIQSSLLSASRHRVTVEADDLDKLNGIVGMAGVKKHIKAAHDVI